MEKRQNQRSRQMEIPSDISYIRKIGTEIEDFLKVHDIDPSSIFDVRLSVEEAIRNSIIHGNKNDKKLPVLIKYSLEGGKFKIEIEDRGAGFDHRRVPDPTTDENLLREGGRGVFLIKKLMDIVKYSGRGNRINMVKFIRKTKGEGYAGKARR